MKGKILMRKKVIVHSMNLKNMESFIKYYKKHGLEKKIKLIKIESKNPCGIILKLKKFYYMYLTKYDAIVSDYPTRLLEKSTKISIAMGHGTAIKKFPSDEELKDEKKLALCKSIKKADYYLTTSERQNHLEFRNEILDKESKNTYLPLGLPKNDYYFDDKKVNKVNYEVRQKLGFHPEDFIVLYAPTWRDYKINRNALNKEDLIKLDRLLGQRAGYMIYRPHKLGGTIDEKLLDSLKLNRIINLGNLNIDTFQSLCIANALISDYSSIAIEFLPLNRPIIFYLFDEEEYVAKRGINFDYNDENISPGLVVKNSNELLSAFKKLLDNEFNNFYWKTRRSICLSNHYTYPDGKASERIWNLILSHL